MELIEVMKNRRSIRNYTGDGISKDIVEKIVKAGMQAPSSMNKRPVEYIIVEDKEMLEKLSVSKAHGSQMLKDASCAIVVIGDAEKADAWIEDASLAMGYMMLMSESLGVASCWVQIRLRKREDGSSSDAYVKNILGVPRRFQVESILSLGMAENELEPRDWDEKDKVHLELY